MEDRISAGLSRAQLRSFGLTVGLAFAALGALGWWRGHPREAIAFGAIGGVLVAMGAAVPALLGPVYRAWMGLAAILSKFTTPVFLGVVYFLLFTPIGRLRRALGKDALDRPAAGDSYWKPRAQRTSGSMERLF